MREGEAGTNTQGKHQNCGDEKVVTKRSMRDLMHGKTLLEAKLDGGLDIRRTYPRKVGTKNQPCGESNPMRVA